MITWAAMFLFEYLAPMIEVVGWITIPVALLLGALNVSSLVILIALAFGVGLLNSMVALLLDESYGYFNSKADTARLIVMVLIENFGMRQITVVWRIRAIIGGKATRAWGNMERKGVANLGGSRPAAEEEDRTSASAAHM
jgi:hypothetical protein